MKRFDDSSVDFLPSRRLLAAADAILAAASAKPAGLETIEVWQGDADLAPDNIFTPDELSEAMLFLIRLDIITLTPAASKRGQRRSHP